jgi:MATE family multidrug resistance protein
VSTQGAERLEEEAEERLKRTVAHDRRGAERYAQTATGPDSVEESRIIAVVEGRPQDSSAFDRKRAQAREVTRELFDLAWPIAAAMLGETAIGLVDTKLVGGLGAAALGGVGVATTFMYLCYALSYGTMRGVKVRAAHAVGEGNPLHGFAFARAGLLLGLGFGLVVLIACRDVGPVLVLVGADPEIIPFAREFLAAVTLGAPAACALSALIQHRQGIGDSRTPMVIGIAGNAFNALLAWCLIYGRGGLPALGVRGAGYSTALAQSLELAVMLALLVRDERRALAGTPLRPATLALRQAFRDVAELGLPTGIQFWAETLAFTAFTVVLGSISKEEIAAHQIALNVMRVSFLPGVAVGEATSVLVGRALGSRRLDLADAALRSGLALGVGFMALCGLVFASAGGALAGLFSADPAVIATARKLLVLAAVFQVLDAVNIVLRGALRGARDVRVVAMIAVTVIWTFLPTSAWLLGKVAGLGALGGWLGFVGETTFAAILLGIRWRRAGWRRDYGG